MRTDAAPLPPLPPTELLAILVERLHVVATDSRAALVEMPIELLDALAVFGAETQDNPPGEGQWWPVAKIADAGLATLFAKAAQLALA